MFHKQQKYFQEKYDNICVFRLFFVPLQRICS